MTSRPICSFPNELETLCNQVEEKAKTGFDDIVKECNIDLGRNKKLASEYYSLVSSNNKLEKQIRRLKIWRWVLIIFLIFPFFLMTNAAKKKQALLDSGSKEENKVQNELDQQLANFIPKISYDLMYKKLIEPLWKDISFDIYQDALEYKAWQPVVNKVFTNDSCLTTLLSGKIFGNPFMMYNYKQQLWGTRTYTGSVPVTYTEHVNGQTVTRTELAVASETLPEPYWNYGTELAYLFERANKLCFTNNTTKHEFKKANKKQQLPMENKKFDKVFPALRNDEKDYRVLFTPLAQENYVNLFSKNDYSVEKNEEVTMVRLPNTKAYLDVTPNEAFDYDLEAWKTKYASWTKRFVKDVGTLTLPIANIPLYTQFENKPASGTTGKTVASALQVEDNLSHLLDTFNGWGQFDTDVIFKPLSTEATTVGDSKFSKTTIQCNYFFPKHEIITKPAVSPHGIPAMVPINIIRYLPRTKNIAVYQSSNLNCSTKETILAGKALVHRGQIMFIGGTKMPDSLIGAIKNYKK